MFKFLNFDFLLKIIYFMSKISGFIYISIDFDSNKLAVKKHFWNTVLFASSFGFSLAANSYDSWLPVSDVTHSKLLEIGTNFIAFFTIWATCFLKVANGIQSQRFFEILSNLQWGERNVIARKIKSKLILI